MGSSLTTDNSRIHCLTYANGDRYEGEMVNGVREGKGTYFYHNGDKYEGWWQGNKKNGMGTLYYKNGNLHIGQWINSEKNGFGSFYYRSGDKYHGEFVNGKQEGRGKFMSRDGSTYSGYFSQNQKDGKGIMYYSKGKISKEVWEKGVLHSSKFIYEDEDEDDKNNNYIRHNDKDYFMEMPQINFLSGNDLENPANNTMTKCAGNQNENCLKTNIFTLEVAKYFKARIPNNYFDAMEIVLNTNDLIYDNPKITEWSEEDVAIWLKRIGIDKYDDIIEKNNINGIRFLKTSYNELKALKIDDVKDVKLILKSIDFLRIFVRLQLDFSDTLEHQNETTPVPSNVVTTQKISDKPYNSAMPSKMPQWDLSKRSISNSTLTMSHTNTVDKNMKDIIAVSPQNKNESMVKEDKEEIVENVENAITKMAISKYYSYITF